MQSLTSQNFGLLVAYVLPGFVVLCGAGCRSSAVEVWMSGPAAGAPTVGGFLYVTLASLAAGMTVSAVRWAVVDTLHHVTGLRRPVWNDRQLAARLPAFEALVENHYRYYQFYSHMFVALALAYPACRGLLVAGLPLRDWGFLMLEGVFLAASRDALGRYYRRSALVLGTRERQVDHDQRTRQRRNRSESSKARQAGAASGRETKASPSRSDGAGHQDAGSAVAPHEPNARVPPGGESSPAGG